MHHPHNRTDMDNLMQRAESLTGRGESRLGQRRKQEGSREGRNGGENKLLGSRSHSHSLGIGGYLTHGGKDSHTASPPYPNPPNNSNSHASRNSGSEGAHRNSVTRISEEFKNDVYIHTYYIYIYIYRVSI